MAMLKTHWKDGSTICLTDTAWKCWGLKKIQAKKKKKHPFTSKFDWKYKEHLSFSTFPPTPQTEAEVLTTGVTLPC